MFSAGSDPCRGRSVFVLLEMMCSHGNLLVSAKETHFHFPDFHGLRNVMVCEGKSGWPRAGVQPPAPGLPCSSAFHTREALRSTRAWPGHTEAHCRLCHRVISPCDGRVLNAPTQTVMLDRKHGLFPRADSHTASWAFGASGRPLRAGAEGRGGRAALFSNPHPEKVGVCSAGYRGAA